MNPLAKHMAAGSVLLGISALSVSACVHDDSTLYIQNVLAPPAVTNGMGCVYTSDPTQAYISGGTFDVDFRSSYSAEFLVGNQMVDQGDPTKPATETSRIALKGAIVKIDDTSGNEIKSFSEATSGTINPISGTNPSFLPVGATLIDSATAQSLLPTITPGPLGGRTIVEFDVHIRFYGNTLGGQYVESNDFVFPVDVCAGCLIAFSAQSDNPNFPQPNCLGNGSSSTQATSVPCNLEDFAIDCSVCANAGVSDCSPNAGAAPLDAGAG